MKQKIIDLLKSRKELTVSQIMVELGVSRQYIHRVLASMLKDGKVQKLGTAPVTYYRLRSEEVSHQEKIILTSEKEIFLKKHFIWITEIGERFEGVEAMSRWCNRFHLPLEKTIDEYIRTRQKYLDYYDKHGLISGIEKIRNTAGFQEIGLDGLYYQDFYAIERFGKTKLGSILHFAKQGQNREMIIEIADQIRPTILQLISRMKVDAVGYIPPTIRRDIQFMNVLENRLNLPLPHIHLVKVKGEIVVPQKALSKLEDRIQNARASIMVAETRHFSKILLVDDAVGSGATINETSLKLKSRQIGNYIIGYAVTGSYKGFDVIQEV